MRRSPLLLIALALLALGSCKPAISESKRHFLLANDFLFKDDLENAKKEYEIAINADTTDWQACYELAGIYELEGDFRNAALYFGRTQRLNPAFAIGYYNKANLEQMMGDEKGSMRDLKAAVAHKKDFFSALMAKARMEFSKGDFKNAISDLNNAIAARPDFFLAYSLRGSCKYKSGDVAGAIADFNKEIELMPSHVMGYVNRGLAYGEQKNFRAAIADMSSAINVDPLWTQSYLYRGMFYINIKEKDSACGDFRMAYKLKNPEAEAYSKQYCK